MILRRRLKTAVDMQAGYFTARQAVDAGYSRNLIDYHVHQGNWVSVDRGLYCIKNYPEIPEGNLIRWALWIVGRNARRKAVISFGSALAYYGLAIDHPQDVHMTIPSGQRTPERPGLILHRQELGWNDVHQKQGFNITTPYRTLLDMKPELLLTRKWVDTVTLAQDKNLIDSMMAEQLLSGMMSYVGSFSGEKVQKGKAMATSQIQSVSMPGLDAASASRQQGDPSFARVRRKGILGSQSAFTLVELLVVVTIIAILAAMLMPSLMKAKRSAYQAVCGNNLKQFGLVFTNYSADYVGYLPLARNGGNQRIRNWQYQITAYIFGYMPVIDGVHPLPRSALYICPASTNFLPVLGSPDLVAEISSNYAYQFAFGQVGADAWQYPASNTYIPKRIERFIKPGRITCMTDGMGNTSTYATDPAKIDVSRHGNLENYLFVDSHVKSSSYLTMEPIQLQLNRDTAGYNLHYR